MPGKTAELKKALLRLVPSTLQEKDCLNYEVAESEKTPNTFLVLMRWKNMAGLDAHNHSAHITEFVKKYENILYDKNGVSEEHWFTC